LFGHITTPKIPITVNKKTIPIISPTVVTTGETISSGSRPLLNDIKAVITLIIETTQIRRNPVKIIIAINFIKVISSIISPNNAI
jgi:hypothetical protein